MKSVGIKQLKAHLSDYVRQARGGEVILVTDRDEVVAELSAPKHRARRAEDWDDTLDLLAGRGAIERASVTKRGWTWKPHGLGLPSGTAHSILDELRADRPGAADADEE